MKRLNSMRLPAQRDQRGQSAVEIALLLPVLLLLLWGIIMASFIFYASIQVTNAAREGARAGSVYLLTVGSTCTPSCMSLDTTVKNAVYNPNTSQSALGYLSTTGGSFNVINDVTTSYVVAPSNIGVPNKTCNASTPCAGDQLTVQVTYRYTVPVVSAMLPMFPQPIVFSPIVTMEVQ